MADELKPCPFCGQRLTLDRDGGLWQHPVHEVCIIGQMGLMNHPRKITAWNRRAPAPSSDGGV